jgi:uncharacterized protein
MPEITYKTELDTVDWAEMKATLHQDAFDNGRSPQQLKTSFENGDAIVGLGHYQGRSKVTGKTFKVPFAHVWFMKEGRIIKLNHNVNTLMLHRAITVD